MKKMGKRLVAVMLAVVMCLGLVPVLGAQRAYAAVFEPDINLEEGYIRMYTYIPYAGTEPAGIKTYEMHIHPVDDWPRIRITESWTDADGNEVTGSFMEGKEYQYKAVIQSLAGTAESAKNISAFTVDVRNWATLKSIVWHSGYSKCESVKSGKNYILTYTAAFVAEAPPKRDQGTYVVDLESGEASVLNNDAFRWAFISTVSESSEYNGYFKSGTDFQRELDLDRDGTMDLGINYYDGYIYGNDKYEFFKLPTCSIKDEFTLTVSEADMKSFIQSEMDHYSKIQFVFNKQSDSDKPGPAKTDTPAANTQGSTAEPKKNDTYVDNSSGATYLITSNSAIAYVSSKANKTSVNVPAEVKIGNKKYKVTEIKANAFKNNKKLKKVTIGKNIKKIGKNAFYGCKNLKKITVKTTKLTKKSIGKNAFAKMNAKAKVKVPKKKLKVYKKILKARGVKGKKQKITK